MKCSARAQQTGERCRNNIKAGATVCHIHGGKSAKAENAAKRG
jgi:hypothetical protein